MDIRVGAYAIITDPRERILLAHWHQGVRPAWTLPGGGLEPGEDPADAAVREVFEETGYHVTLSGLLGVDSRVVAASDRLDKAKRAPLQSLRIVYRAEIVGGELRNEVGGSTDRAEWFALPDVAGLPRVSLVGVGLELAGLVVPTE